MSKLLVLALIAMMSTAVYAKEAFTGTWIGTGMVTFKGKPDPIFCKVRNMNKAGRVFYSMFTCTIPRLGKGSLTIESEKINSSKFKGQYKDEYNGNKINLLAKLKGDKMDVKVSSSSWNGYVNFQKKK